MQRRKLNWANPTGILRCLAFLRVVGGTSMAQTNPAPSAVAYALLAGSQLLDDCPICDHVSIPVPISGTFRLRLTEANPFFGTYGLLDIQFQTGTNAGRPYSVTGGGPYEYGGPGGVVQNATLNLTINDGFSQTLCYCSNLVHSAGNIGPEIQMNVDQTNGKPARVFHLKILAAPMPQITAVIPQPATGDLRLEWEANGQQIQVEKAENVAGPYTALGPVTTEQAYTDVGALTNRTQSYYRLRQW